MADYRVGVELALSGNIQHALGAISASMLRLHYLQARITQGFIAWRPAIMGAVGAFAGFEVGVKGLMGIANASKDLLHQQNELVKSGVALNDVLKLQNEFYGKIAAKVPTLSASGFLKTVGEMRAVTGPGPEGLAQAAELAQKAGMIDALLGKEGEFYKLLRSEEMKGIATDPKKRDQFADAAFSLITAFHGKLTAQDFQTMARRGGSAWMHMDIEKAMGPVAVLASDIGGSAAGTALMSLYQFQQGAHTLSRQQGVMLMNAGLLKESDIVKTGFMGSRFQLKPGHALAGAKEFSEDLPGWVKNVISPQAHLWAAAEAKRQPGSTEAQLYEQFMQRIMPNRNVAKLGMMFSDPGFLDQIAKDLGLAAIVSSITQAYSRGISQDPTLAEEAYNKQYKSMMEAIGSPVMQAALPIMTAITGLFTSIGNWANLNPDIITNIASGVAALSAGLMILGGGTVLMSLALYLGPIATLFATLTAILPGFRSALADLVMAFAAGDSAKMKVAGTNLVHSLIDGTMSVINLLWNVGTKIVDAVQLGVMGALTGLKLKIQGFFDHSVLPPGASTRLPTPGAPFIPAPSSPTHRHRDMMLLPEIKPQSFMGGGGGGPSTVKVNNIINLDGGAIARAINEHNAMADEHPTQGGRFDPRASFNSNDGQFSST